MIKRRTRKKVQRFPNHLPLAAIAAVVAIIGGVQYFSPGERQIRAEKASLRVEKLQQQAADERARLEALEGNRRYKQKCVMTYLGVADRNGYYHEILPLSPGMRIVSARTGQPIPDGQVVCDHQFMTYEIVNGVTANPARANDPDVVNARFKDYAQWHPEARRGAIVRGD